VGYNVAQAGTDSMGAKEIQELIEHDIPQVGGHAMACTLHQTIPVGLLAFFLCFLVGFDNHFTPFISHFTVRIS